jgi:cytochrome c
MDSFEVTKVAGAVLATALVVLLARFITEQVYPEPDLEIRAYAIAPSEQADSQEAEAPATLPEAPAEPAPAGVATLIAAAEPAAGEKLFKKCIICHNPDKDGKRKIGPNLWDVVAGPVAADEGFAYSDALREKSGETWSYDNLDAFLKKPKDWAPGTKMSFAGLKKPGQRAALIAYLRSLSDNPAALPD